MRNGRSHKTLKTTHGPAEIAVPRDRAGTFEAQVVPKHHSITADVEARIVAMYAQGMTTREIQRHVEALYHFEASEMLVSRILERVEPELVAWRSRELEAVYPIVFIDAVHSKVRHNAGSQRGVYSTALYTVSAYGEAGQHEVLGVYAGAEGEHAAESAAVWHQIFLDLEERGARDLLLVTADGLAGLEQALAAACERYRRRYPSVLNGWQAAWPGLLQLWRFGAPLRRLVYTANPTRAFTGNGANRTRTGTFGLDAHRR